MSEDPLLDTVLDVVQPFLPAGQVLRPDTRLPGLIDSLNTVQIVMALEQRLELRITSDRVAFEDFKTCRHLANALKRAAA